MRVEVRGSQRWSNRLRVWQSAALLATLSLPACQNRFDEVLGETATALDTGGVRQEVQRYFDAHPQCAAVLSTDRKSGMLGAPVGDRFAQALLTAGLIEASGNGSDGNLLYRPTASAAKWFSKRRNDVSPQWLLCYATRDLDALLIDQAGSTPSVRYTFKLKNAAPWLETAAMARTFPAVAATTRGWVFVGEERLHVRDGHLADLNLLQPTELYGLFNAFDAQFRAPENEVTSSATSVTDNTGKRGAGCSRACSTRSVAPRSIGTWASAASIPSPITMPTTRIRAR